MQIRCGDRLAVIGFLQRGHRQLPVGSRRPMQTIFAAGPGPDDADVVLVAGTFVAEVPDFL